MLDDGTVLNENVAVLSKIAELAGAGALAPAPGTPEAALVLNHLSYICSDVHAGAFYGAARPSGLVCNAGPSRAPALTLVDGVAVPRPLAAGFGPLFGPFVNDEAKAKQHEKLAKKLTYINDHMVKGKKFLVGDSFTVADSYLYIVLSWGQYVGVGARPPAESPRRRVAADRERRPRCPQTRRPTRRSRAGGLGSPSWTSSRRRTRAW